MFQGAFDLFRLGLILSLGTTGLHNMSFMPLWALQSLSVRVQNNGAKGKKKRSLFEIDKGRESVFPIKHSGAYLRRSSREVVE